MAPIARTNSHDDPLESEKQSLIEAGRWLDARGYAPATSGNYSMRLGAGRFLVTASGKHKGRLSPEDFVVIDADGRVLEGSSAGPSAETPLHLLMYRLDEAVGAVIHTHSVAVTVLTLLLHELHEADALELTGYELLKAFPSIASHAARVSAPILENSQDVGLLAREVEARWRKGRFPAYLLRGHGAYAWGGTVPLALRSAEALEFLVACELEKLEKRRVMR